MTQTISTPLALKLRRLRYKVLPLTTFCLAVGLTAWLWSRQGSATPAIGEVSIVTLRIVAPSDGRLAQTGAFPRIYDQVTPGQVMASLVPNSLDAADQVVQLVAPAGGSVTAVRRQAGEFVKQGQELFTITRADSPHIITYVRGGTAALPKKDSKVLIRSKHRSATGTVQQVGTSLQPIPEHQLSNPKTPEWGIPVRISLPDAAALPLMPGELVHLSYVAEKG